MSDVVVTASASADTLVELSLERVPAVQPTGNPPLFLLHGWGHTRRCWQSLLPRLTQNREVYLVDLPGFGDSLGVQLPALSDALDALERVLPAECVLVGWSLGGHLALRLARQCPAKVHAVITLATNLSFVARSDWQDAMPRPTFDDFTAAFAQAPEMTLKRFCGLQAQGDSHRKSLLKELREQCVPPAPQQVGQWQAALAWLEQLEHRGDLAVLRVPLLQLFGEEDALVPAQAIPAVRQVSPGRVEAIAGAGHAPHLTHAEHTAALMLEFLEFSTQPASPLPEQTNAQAAEQTRIDKQRMARSFSRAAATYDGVAHVQVEVGNQLLRLSPSVRTGERVLDIGCGTGFCSEYYGLRHAQVTALDIAPGMLQCAQQKLRNIVPQPVQWICADAEHLPFPDNRFSGAVSNLTFQWSEDLHQLFSSVANSLQPGGWLLFSTLGPETLSELRQAWRAVDSYTHVNDFQTVEVWRAALEGAGLIVDTISENTVVPRYQQLPQLMRELKALGAHNVNRQQNPGLTGPRQLRELGRAYEQFRDVNGKLPASYQVIYVLARKVLARKPIRNGDSTT